MKRLSLTGLGRAACEYARRGWPVLPIAPRGKVPMTAHGLKDATTDLDVVRAWWTATPNANIGVRTDDFVVVDADGPIGKHNLLKFCDGVGFQSSPCAWTGGGGLHVWFRRDGHSVRNRAGWLERVDIRSEGGYVIVPPSAHPSGAHYCWEHGPDEREVPSMPSRLVDALMARQGVGAYKSEIARTGVLAYTSPGLKYAATALDAELENVRSASEGVRNQSLVAAAFNLGQLVASGILDAADVVAQLFDAACAAGLTAREAQTTISSGLGAGMTRPRGRR